MSRIANSPVRLPTGVSINLAEQQLTVTGQKGTLNLVIHPTVIISQEEGVLRFAAQVSGKLANAMAGTTRALVNNMVQGVTQGFQKKLVLVGVGYRAQLQDSVLNLTLGFSHPIHFQIPDGITLETPTQTEVIVNGLDKQQVGQVAANIRAYRPPEPYKGKGVRYADEVIVLKEAKKK
jgi:large subunit ribosomal protein L6